MVQNICVKAGPERKKIIKKLQSSLEVSGLNRVQLYLWKGPVNLLKLVEYRIDGSNRNPASVDINHTILSVGNKGEKKSFSMLSGKSNSQK